ncbi:MULTISPECIES: substrate-binding periplasmic protein [Pseudoalteromonas]|uniref:Amino acid ABC transporter substrate-binding protein n=1 Tax=Pseudoalteromonas amylolytica TaxID=1859457 RepID=A0A1S1MSU6_9GAMM|nr:MULTISPECIES: transporter substrate-binding domain-containing protein [Pseudoalteromonas]OHU88415.1 amino acid ABC transporter substrate-binding protein [Pseudoalteromonas sp. JW3]OHU90258.1 amino acid ABC transporter substrate-binding protein [Pseudoalteromonas amylolytica]
MTIKLFFCTLIILFVPVASHAQTLTFYAEDLPPYHFKNARGEASGALIDLARSVLSHAQLEGQFEIVPMARAYKEMQTQPNALMLSLLKTPQRSEQLVWIARTYFADAYLVSLADSPITIDTLQSAKQYRVSTIRGYSSERFLREQGFNEEENLVLVSHYHQLWQLLYKQRTDLVLTNTLTLEKEIVSTGLDPRGVAKKLHLTDFPSELWLAANPKLDAATVQKLRASVQHLKQSGGYQQILARWKLATPQSDK